MQFRIINRHVLASRKIPPSRHGVSRNFLSLRYQTARDIPHAGPGYPSSRLGRPPFGPLLPFPRTRFGFVATAFTIVTAGASALAGNNENRTNADRSESPPSFPS